MAADNEALLRHAFDRLNDGDVDACVALLTPDFVINIAEMPQPRRGRAAWRAHAETLLAAIPDAHVEVLDAVSQGDRVAVRVRVSGTHRGELLGSAPTGRSVSYLSHEVYRFEDDRIAEEWICSDTLTLLTQVGALARGRLAMMWLARYRTWAGFAAGVATGATLAALL